MHRIDTYNYSVATNAVGNHLLYTGLMTMKRRMPVDGGAGGIQEAPGVKEWVWLRVCGMPK